AGGRARRTPSASAARPSPRREASVASGARRRPSPPGPRACDSPACPSPRADWRSTSRGPLAGRSPPPGWDGNPLPDVVAEARGARQGTRGRVRPGPGGPAAALPARRDASEDAVRPVARARGEVQRGRRTGKAAVAEREPPEAVDPDRPAAGEPEGTVRLPVSVGLPLVRVDLPVAEVADQQVAADAAEHRRRHRHAPRRIERALAGHAAEQVSAGVEHVDEAEPRARYVEPLRLVLLRVGDEERATEVLDVERREALRDLLVDKGVGVAHQVEAAVEDVDAGVVEVGGVQLVAGDREPGVDGADTRTIRDGLR